MNIKKLELVNVGPFRDLHLEFPFELDENRKIPVTIITGENGTGKSIILDSMRLLFKGMWGIERNIIADENNFEMSMILNIDGQEKEIKSTSVVKDYNSYGDVKYTVETNDYEYSKSFSSVSQQPIKKYLLDYWSPDLSTDQFEIKSLSILNVERPLETSFERVFKNADVNQFICWVDYVRGSQNVDERKIGEVLFPILSSMITDCLSNGAFKYVSRTNLKPIVEVWGKELSIEKLSMGNLLILTHLVRTLYRAYGIYTLNNWPIEKIKDIEGVLLIDEIENHLHPKWQKRIVNIIQKYFPRLQLIMTTHSPFVISSVENPKIYVCESFGDCSQVRDLSDNYSNLPVDEVLISEVFGVGPFNEKISSLISEKEKAVKENNEDRKLEIEKELVKLNQSYFSFYLLGKQLGLNNETY